MYRKYEVQNFATTKKKKKLVSKSKLIHAQSGNKESNNDIFRLKLSSWDKAITKQLPQIFILI